MFKIFVLYCYLLFMSAFSQQQAAVVEATVNKLKNKKDGICESVDVNVLRSEALNRRGRLRFM